MASGAGLMRERITIQTDVETTDTLGGKAKVPTTVVANLPAQMIPLRSWEHLQAAAIQFELALRFKVRVRSDITAKMRVLWTPNYPRGASQQQFEIVGIVPVDDGRMFMLLECQRS